MGHYKEQSWKECSARKIVPPSGLEPLVSRLREEHKTLSTINGSFDLLHVGHLHILYEASKEADILIVALNSDSSIKQYKGAGRPIIGLQERMEMIAALGFVDYVTWFDEADPRSILQVIKPNVHVNGAEYGENCIEADVVRWIGGRIHLVERVPGLATSEIINRIRVLPCV